MKKYLVFSLFILCFMIKNYLICFAYTTCWTNPYIGNEVCKIIKV